MTGASFDGNIELKQVYTAALLTEPANILETRMRGKKFVIGCETEVKGSCSARRIVGICFATPKTAL